MHTPQAGDTEAVVASHATATPLTESTTMTDPRNNPKTPEQQAFEDAVCHMSQEDWDADNAWLESAGWGEM